MGFGNSIPPLGFSCIGAAEIKMMMNAIQIGQSRMPAQSGRFYPSARRSLGRTVEQLLANGLESPVEDPKAVIAPHAGYRYSGPVAGSAFLPFTRAKEISRVVLIGPSHWISFQGVALPDESEFATPLGTVPVDLHSIGQLIEFPAARIYPPAHAREHSLEVELPFLQIALGRFEIVPLVVGQMPDENLSAMIEQLWGGPETRFVISSDLSHFHEYSTARQLDQETARWIEAGECERVDEKRACGCLPIRAFVKAAAARGLRAQAVDLRTSGDTAGPRDEVVGYGAFLFGDDRVTIA
jgi:MEMO1 family protein